jgi:hypothetical protein
MIEVRAGSPRAAFLLLTAISLAACGGGGGGGISPPVASPPPPPPPPPPPVVNVNIVDPTLDVADNFDVSPGDTLTLVWSDEFDAAQLDPEVWFFENGDGSQYGIPGWGNNELQWYLEDNAELRDGMLVISAREESAGGKNHTSARINTRDRFAFRHGRIEARIRLPGGQGIWPAFWMLPQEDVYGTWAASGEIDIVEAVNLGGAGGNTVFGTIHHGGEFPSNVSSGNDYLVPTDATTGFHTYALEWDSTVPEMRWYVDDILKWRSITSGSIAANPRGRTASPAGSVRCRSRRFPDLYRGRHYLGTQQRSLAPNGSNQRDGRLLRHLRKRLVDRRERWVDLPRKRDIVKACHGQLVGNLDAQPISDADDAGGHVVVRCENGRRSILESEQLHRAFFAGPDRVVARCDEALRKFQVALFQAVPITEVAIADRLGTRVTRYKRDPRMPQ